MPPPTHQRMPGTRRHPRLTQAIRHMGDRKTHRCRRHHHLCGQAKHTPRPIVLLEPSYKLIEAIIESRTSRALSDSSSLDPSQYGFTHNTGADDLLITTCMVYEDAHQHNKEIHTSNNDCTKAYDSIAHWVMETIYHYHRLPPKLIRFLINTDKHHRGHVLTAHGAGPEFEKDCGLGQGSVLAPLKWKLFLDPLLKQLRKIVTPYHNGNRSRHSRHMGYRICRRPNHHRPYT